MSRSDATPVPSPDAPSPLPAPRPVIAIGDTNAGWRIGGGLLLLACVLSTLRLNLTRDGGSESPIGPLLGAALAAVAGVGLLRDQAWAKWMALGMAGLAGVVLIVTPFMLNARDLPYRSAVLPVVAGVWVIAGWFLLLDRPASKIKIGVGAAMVLSLQIAGFVHALSGGGRY